MDTDAVEKQVDNMTEAECIAEWEGFAFNIVRRYKWVAKGLGIELSDLRQIACIGLLLAYRAYIESDRSLSYQSFAFTMVRSEVQRAIYTDVNKGKLRTSESPLSPELVEEVMGVANDESFEDADNLSFCFQLPLSEGESRLLHGMVVGKASDAVNKYRQSTGVTKQHAYNVRKKVRKVASYYV